MTDERERVATVAHSLQQHLGDAPSWALVSGSGLGPVRDALTDLREHRADTFGLPVSTVPGHAGRIGVGKLAGEPMALVSGRVHTYEGWSMPEVVRYVRALHAWGVRRLVLTCSAGGVTPDMQVGRLVLLSDHLNMTGRSPLVGTAYGERFPDLSQLYSPRLRAELGAIAASRRIALETGIYAWMLGPSYETPAEVRAVRTLGADLVGMSTVPEALACAEIGMEVLAIALVSNRAAGLEGAELDHDLVQQIAGKAADQLAQLLTELVPSLTA